METFGGQATRHWIEADREQTAPKNKFQEPQKFVMWRGQGRQLEPELEAKLHVTLKRAYLCPPSLPPSLSSTIAFEMKENGQFRIQFMNSIHVI